MINKKLKPGQECGHRGCARHLSHPCEGCGRYAAGMTDRPDVDATMKKLHHLSLEDSFIAFYLNKDWLREQILAAMVLELYKRNTEIELQLIKLMDEIV